jgi:intracellular sulfur oxidation DsrE/DsrF family protein
MAQPTSNTDANINNTVVHRAVYELNDERITKCQAVLRSMGNHIKGKGGADYAHLALMIHDEAHAYFLTESATDLIKEMVENLQAQKAELFVCGNTLKRFGVDPSRLLPGLVVKPEGAMVAITDLVLAGYVYLRP